jgi:hypothetical protein
LTGLIVQKPLAKIKKEFNREKIVNDFQDDIIIRQANSLSRN